MRKVIVALVLTLLLEVVATVCGCQWAKFEEAWKGPATKADCPPSAGVGFQVGRMEFIPIGDGEWKDEKGGVHKETVYVLREKREGVKGPVGEKGPVGLAMAAPARKVTVTPKPSGSSFDANSGSYRRDIMVVSPPWGSDPAKTVSGVEPFKAKPAGTPSYSSRDFAVGEGHGSSFVGGDMADWKDTVRRGPILLMILGGLMLAAGIIVAIWAGRLMLGIAVAAAGLALIATGVLFEMYPWVVLIALAAVLGIGVWWFLDAKGLLKAKTAVAAQATALSAVVRGVESAAPEAQAAVKAEIAKAAGVEKATVKATITQVKTEAGV